jgi:nitrate/nitrite transport system substrate-binding protein
MKRRQFLKYSGLGATGLAFSACGKPNIKPTQNQNELSSTNDQISFGDLEKKDLNLGFIPIIEAAPLIIAKEQGFFQNYGLNVKLTRYSNWEEIDQNLRKYSLDGGQALLAMPLKARLDKSYAPMTSLMMLNRNGGAIVLNQKAWDAKLRPSIEYSNFREFSNHARSFFRSHSPGLKLGLDDQISTNSYLLRYWLAAMGIDPEKEVELTAFPPSQMLDKLQAGIVNGYCLNDPWTQQANSKKASFTTYLTQEIWHNHPGNILAVMQPWIENHPTTARALVAAILEACQFCDRPENRPLVAQILAQTPYLNLESQLTEKSLVNPYNYGGFDQQERQISIPDFIFFHDFSDSLKKPDHANYPWLSDGIWILTQMIRWNQIPQRQYPKDADKILAQTYPQDIYQDVAKALKINLPAYRIKSYSEEAFIDQRPFNPSQPVTYLNQFEIRA